MEVELARLRNNEQALMKAHQSTMNALECYNKDLELSECYQLHALFLLANMEALEEFIDWEKERGVVKK